MVGNERRHLVVLRRFGRAGGFGRVGKADQEDRCGGRNADEQAEAKRRGAEALDEAGPHEKAPADGVVGRKRRRVVGFVLHENLHCLSWVLGL